MFPWEGSAKGVWGIWNNAKTKRKNHHMINITHSRFKDSAGHLTDLVWRSFLDLLSCSGSKPCTHQGAEPLPSCGLDLPPGDGYGGLILSHIRSVVSTASALLSPCCWGLEWMDNSGLSTGTPQGTMLSRRFPMAQPWLRPFGVCTPCLSTCYTSVVSSAIQHTAVWWGTGSSHRKGHNKPVRRASSVLAASWTLWRTCERRMLDKPTPIMENTSHPLHPTVEALSSTFRSFMTSNKLVTFSIYTCLLYITYFSFVFF